MVHRAIAASLIAAILAFSTATPVRADDYPSGNVTVVVGLGAGSAMDVITRMYGQALSTRFGKPFVVENRGAAAGNVAAEFVSRAQPDGRTLFVASSGVFAINGIFFKSLPYDAARDFAPIAVYLKTPFILVTSAQSPIKSLPELTKAAKAEPGKITYASSGVALAPHLAGELLKMKLGIDLNHVPYKGNWPQAVGDVAARHVDLAFSDPSVAIPLIKAGKLRALGVSSSARLPQLPDVPTIAEVIGAPDFEAVSWHAIVAPAKTPQPVIDALSAAMIEAFKDPAIVGRIETMGLMPMKPPLSPAATKAFMQAETVKWGDLLKRLNLVASQ